MSDCRKWYDLRTINKCNRFRLGRTRLIILSQWYTYTLLNNVSYNSDSSYCGWNPLQTLEWIFVFFRKFHDHIFNLKMDLEPFILVVTISIAGFWNWKSISYLSICAVFLDTLFNNQNLAIEIVITNIEVLNPISNPKSVHEISRRKRIIPPKFRVDFNSKSGVNFGSSRSWHYSSTN